MSAPREYPAELRERAVRLVFESGQPIAQIAQDRAGVGEAAAVVADLGENAGAGQRSQAWLAGDQLGVGVLGELLGGGGGQVLGAAAGGLKLAEQRQRLAAHGLLHQRWLVQVGGVKDGTEPSGFGVDAAGDCCIRRGHAGAARLMT